MHLILVRQFASFILVGGIATAAHYALLVSLAQLCNVSPVTASMAGYLLGALINYMLNYTLTFRSNKRHSEALTRFFTVAAIGFGLNAAIMSVAVNGLRIHYLPSQIAATVIVLLWNFTANKFWTFRENASAER